MNENEIISKLEILDSQISTEFENLHESLYQKERSIRGLIQGIKTYIDIGIEERLTKSEVK